jgi:hypothetical protein
MYSAPEKRRVAACLAPVTATAAAPTNPALDELITVYEQQSRLLDAALSSARSLGDVPVAVRAELLEAIDEACTVRAALCTTLPSVNRC